MRLEVVFILDASSRSLLMAAVLAAATLSPADISVVLSPDGAGVDAELEVFRPVDGVVGTVQFLTKRTLTLCWP